MDMPFKAGVHVTSTTLKKIKLVVLLLVTNEILKEASPLLLYYAVIQCILQQMSRIVNFLLQFV